MRKIKYLATLVLISLGVTINAFGKVVQGNLSNGTPYYYTVSDTPYEPNVEVKQTETTNNNSNNNNSYSSKSEEEKYKAEQKAAEEKAKREAEEGAARKAEEERKAQEEALKAIEEAKRAALEAEYKQQDLLRKYSKTKAYADEQTKAYIEKHNITDANKKNYKEILDKINSKASVDYYKLQKASEIMEQAYNRLGALYKEYNYAGDPVNIATGEYVVEYVDFEAQDFLKKFTVDRNYKYGTTTGSFGRNWICSLDTRIIRCIYESWDEDEQRIKEIISNSQSTYSDMQNYAQNYNSTFPMENLNEMMTELANWNREFTSILPMVQQLGIYQKSVENRNRYVTYGKYADPYYYYGLDNMLIYVDEKGSSSYFVSDGNGTWNSYGTLGSEVKIYDRNDGGYVVVNIDGSSKEYTAYGILEKEIDSNGNITLYWNDSGRITQIQLKTGEIIHISRNSDGNIVTIQGPQSGVSTYYYSYDMITGVMDNKGVYVGYNYDNYTYLSRITRADGSYLDMEYEYNKNKHDYVCAKVSLSNGGIETFEWDTEESVLTHVALNGVEETYKYNDYRQPVYVKDCKGNVTEFELNSDNLISKITENGVVRTIQYDSTYRPVTIKYENGSYSSIKYNSLGQITEYIDPDGYITSISYDSKGNITEVYYCGNHIVSYDYYPNGLVKEKIEDEVTSEYTYNKFGSVLSVTNHYTDGKVTKQLWEYNGENKPSKYTDEFSCVTEFSYEPNKIIELYNGRKRTEHWYDNREREYKTVITDLKTGKQHKKQVFFDWNNNVVKTLLDDELYEEKNYSIDGVLQEATIWNLIKDNTVLEKQGIRTKFEYDTNDNLYTTQWSILDYVPQDYVRYVSPKQYKALILINQLSKKVTSSSENRNTYTKGGRVKTKVDENLTSYTYSYRTDGSYHVCGLTSKGLNFDFEYDFKGLLKKKTDVFGNKYTYSYDTNKNLISEAGPTYEKKWEYDSANRLIHYELNDDKSNLISEKTYVYDDLNFILNVQVGGIICELLTLDVWNRPIEVVNKDGKRFRDYDVLNHAVKETDSYGNIIRVEYDTLGNPGYVLYGDGSENYFIHDIYGDILNYSSECKTLLSKTKNTDADILLKTDYFGRETYSYYDDKEYLIKKQKPVTGEEIFKWNSNHTELSVTYSNGTQNSFKYDVSGNLIYEKNASGNVREYKYDNKNRIISKILPDGMVEEYTYDDNNNKVVIKNSKGETAEITRNIIGLVTEIKSNSCNYHYEYDLSGNILSFTDYNTLLHVNYDYDDYGRCIKKDTGNCCIEITYDDSGRIQKMQDSSTGAFVTFSYDGKNREIQRYYSNGLKTDTIYNTRGVPESRITRDRFDIITAADFILYDENDRIVLECNKEGLWKKYSYDKNGRLSKCIYPYTEELADFYLNEAWNCGIYIKELERTPEYLGLGRNEIEQLNACLEKAGVNFNISLARSMKAWEEDYTYTEMGNISSVHNLYGTILYDYDAENRLVAKYGANSETSGMTFLWNDNGNLNLIKNNQFKIDFEYASNNRPNRIINTDFITNEQRILTYGYDLLGRRIYETLSAEGEENTIYYSYDGLSLDILQSTPVMGNSTALSNYTGNNYLQRKNEVRWIDDTGYEAYGSFRYIDSDSYNGNMFKGDVEQSLITSSERTREERAYTMINYNGLPVINVYVGASSSTESVVDFLVYDYKGNTVKVMDENLKAITENTYDCWGNILSGNKSLSFSYSNSLCDINQVIYNLGFRDYLPSMKIFTTMDPVRDGSNWYAYCAGDPVNFQDRNGLTIGKTLGYDLMTNYDDSMLIGNSPDEKFNQNGCYVITFVNMINTLVNVYGVDVDESYRTAENINNQKDMFCSDPEYGGMLKDKAGTMNRIFGDNFDDYFTERLSGIPAIKAYLAKINASPEEYLVAAVFDLSDANKDVSNHMVALNQNFNEDGELDSVDGVTASSFNDKDRIINNNQLDVYNIDNVKEIRIIKTGKTACAK